jgi:hypothetical protein
MKIEWGVSTSFDGLAQHSTVIEQLKHNKNLTAQIVLQQQYKGWAAQIMLYGSVIIKNRQLLTYNLDEAKQKAIALLQDELAYRVYSQEHQVEMLLSNIACNKVFLEEFQNDNNPSV